MADAQLEVLRQAARAEAGAAAMPIDTEAYTRVGRDPLEPLLGSGDLASPIGFLGRDPGRDEVRLMQPLIGAGGRLVRGALGRARGGAEPVGEEAMLRAGDGVFFSNTVPYKPLGNKAWSMGVKRRFLPIIRSLLVDVWQGAELITLGNVAFEWFAIDAPPATREAIAAHWQREDRYEASLEIEVASPRSGRVRTIRLHPLPHPSPLNATWFQRFPSMLDARLAAFARDGISPTG
ncbi:MAG: uracil-DNA glycosylase family protein [Myxococcota bacterium]